MNTISFLFLLSPTMSRKHILQHILCCCILLSESYCPKQRAFLQCCKISIWTSICNLKGRFLCKYLSRPHSTLQINYTLFKCIDFQITLKQTAYHSTMIDFLCLCKDIHCRDNKNYMSPIKPCKLISFSTKFNFSKVFYFNKITGDCIFLMMRH